jgi:hypothetical protein
MEGRKEGRMEGKEGRKAGWKGRKEGRQDGREGRKDGWMEGDEVVVVASRQGGR